MKIFDIENIAITIMTKIGISFDDVYNGSGGIKSAQLKLITKVSNYFGSYFNENTGETTTLKKNIYTTINRLENSKNRNEIDIDKNVKNTMIGTVKYILTDKIENSLTKQQKKTTMIKWIPSSAEEQDPVHALYYGKTMSIGRAIKLGLGKRYGCQCSMQILNANMSDIINNKLEQ